MNSYEGRIFEKHLMKTSDFFVGSEYRKIYLPDHSRSEFVEFEAYIETKMSSSRYCRTNPWETPTTTKIALMDISSLVLNIFFACSTLPSEIRGFNDLLMQDTI